MCLITKNQKLQEAKEDICCYKILLQSNNNPKRIITPFMKIPITLNQLAIAEGTPRTIRRFGYSIQLFEISKGVIHCFEDLDRAAGCKYLIQQDQAYRYFYQVIIVKAIIPKGTLYTTGTDRDICATEVFITNDIILS